MPEAAAAFLERGLLEDARSIQNQILSDYERDVSKHLSRTEAEYAIAAWRSIPSHLGRENKKFVFGHIAQGARARNYQSGITWLEQAGLVTKVRRISKPGLPLCPYADDAAFKLFLLDVGLLGAMVHLDKSTVIGGSASRSSRAPSPSSTSASSWCRSAGSRRTTGPPRTRRAR